MKNELTNINFWEKKWKNKSIYDLPKKLFFQKYIKTEFVENKSVIEIGGFPGLILAYFKINYNSNVNLLDYYIDNDLVNKIEIENGISKNSIKLIKTDFFSYKSDVKYDFVFSNGFIEHFVDTQDVIERHVNLMSENSQLLILLPNLKGLNGIVHKYFDNEIYKIHNLDSMDIIELKRIMSNYYFDELQVEYINKPMIWISGNKSLRRKILKVFIRLISSFIKLIPIPSQFLSAYIVISAIRKNDAKTIS